MKKRSGIIFTLLIIACQTFSQATYVKWINTELDEMPTNLQKLNNSPYYFFSAMKGHVSENPSYYDIYNYSSTYYLADNEFNFTDSLKIDNIDGYRISPGHMVKDYGSMVLLWGSALDTTTLDEQLYLLWLDYELNVIKDSIYGLPDRNDAMSGCTINHSDNIVFIGSRAIGKNTEYDSIKYNFWEFDANGTENCYKEGTLSSLSFIGIVDMVNVGKYQVESINKTIRFDYDYEIDTMCDFQIDHFIPVRMKKISDSTYFLLGQYDEQNMPPESYFDLAFMVRDESPVAQELFTFGVPDTNDHIGSIDLIDNETFFLGGTKNFNCGGENSWFSLYKTNYFGEIFLEKYYGGNGVYRLAGLISTEDGGCIITGTRSDLYYPGQNIQHDIVIMKTDANGMIAGMEETNEFRIAETLLYPNPFIDFIYVETGRHEQTELLIFDITGRKVVEMRNLTNGRIDLSHLTDGVYIYMLRTGSGYLDKGKIIKRK